MKATWKNCNFCGVVADYNEQYDAAYCATCDRWLEKGCGKPASPDCYYDCINRPPNPSQVTAPCIAKEPA